MKLSCDTLEILTFRQQELNEVTVYAYSKYIDSVEKIFSVGSNTKKMYSINFNPDEGDGPLMSDLKRLSKAPTDIQASIDGEFVSIGFEDGTINICESHHLHGGNYYKFRNYRAHEIAIVSQ